MSATIVPFVRPRPPSHRGELGIIQLAADRFAVDHTSHFADHSGIVSANFGSREEAEGAARKLSRVLGIPFDLDDDGGNAA